MKYIALILLVFIAIFVIPSMPIGVATAQSTGYKRITLPTILTEPLIVNGEGGTVELVGKTSIDYFGSDRYLIMVYNASKVIVSISLDGKAVGTVDEFHVLYIDAGELVIKSLIANMKVIVFGRDWYDTRVFELNANRLTIDTVNLRLTVSSPDEIDVLDIYTGFAGSGELIDGGVLLANSYQLTNFVGDSRTDYIGSIIIDVTAKYIVTDLEENGLYVMGLYYWSDNNIRINSLRVNLDVSASRAYYVYAVGAYIGSSSRDIVIDRIRVPKILAYGGENLEEAYIYGFVSEGSYGTSNINTTTMYIGRIGIGNKKVVNRLYYAGVVGAIFWGLDAYIKRIIIRDISMPMPYLVYELGGIMYYHYYITGIELYANKLKYDMLLLLGIEYGLPLLSYRSRNIESRSGVSPINLGGIDGGVNANGTISILVKGGGFIDVYDPDLDDYRAYFLSRGDKVKIVFEDTPMGTAASTYLSFTRFGIGATYLRVAKIYVNGELIGSNTIVYLGLGKSIVKGSIKLYNGDTGELVSTLTPLSTAINGFYITTA